MRHEQLATKAGLGQFLSEYRTFSGAGIVWISLSLNPLMFGAVLLFTPISWVSILLLILGCYMYWQGKNVCKDRLYLYEQGFIDKRGSNLLAMSYDKIKSIR